MCPRKLLPARARRLKKPDRKDRTRRAETGRTGRHAMSPVEIETRDVLRVSQAFQAPWSSPAYEEGSGRRDRCRHSLFSGCIAPARSTSRIGREPPITRQAWASFSRQTSNDRALRSRQQARTSDCNLPHLTRLISTRRFSARPASVPLSATGRDAPKP